MEDRLKELTTKSYTLKKKNQIFKRSKNQREDNRKSLVKQQEEFMLKHGAKDTSTILFCYN